MKIGITIGYGTGMSRPEVLTEIAVHAERLNFSSLLIPEHVVVFEQYASSYPYTADGLMAIASDRPFLNPYVGLAYVAALTRRIRLITNISIVAAHNPLILAKEIATLDYLSGGRFALGAGLGWMREEFQALGISFDRRAKRTRECIAVMRSLWSEPSTTFHGEFFNLDNAMAYPKPAQGGRLPILFGGESAAALRRVATIGDGWIGANMTPDEFAAKREHLFVLARQAGRDPEWLVMMTVPAFKPERPADLKRYHEAGVHELVLMQGLPKRVEEVAPVLERMAREWVEPAMQLG
ncbi:MAG TPA: LLM class F420-dependent oxidoreductase [Candidatus Binataceae bacterium]|nr:LLM class F420-dependent oxidoreductase [Candidatus Binataceae bacterium]